jgi:NAD(P)-dependent dehydrogenase (short-subunit alcohol dehydrogenase family)
MAPSLTLKPTTGINLTGMFLSAQRAVKEFIRRGPVESSPSIGKVINMSSVHDSAVMLGLFLVYLRGIQADANHICFNDVKCGHISAMSFSVHNYNSPYFDNMAQN